jgi:putative FmdB family regulatory protein
MPTYEYLCPKCEKTFEVFQSMKDKPLTKCPDKACKGRVKRLLGTGAGLIFKGSGFYITDYRSEGYKSAARSDSAAGSSAASAASTSASSDSGGSPKTEAKPAAKSTGETKPAAKPKKGGG